MRANGFPDDFPQTLIDAMPSFVFVVTREVEILTMNEAAAKAFGPLERLSMKRLCGEVLCCVNVYKSDALCGETAECEKCVIRNGVHTAVAGMKTFRKKCHMQLVLDETARPFVFLATVSPFVYRDRSVALVVLEDVSELFELRNLLPMCAWCKSVRIGDDVWHKIETYLANLTDAELTHSICPECSSKLTKQDQELAE